MVNQESDYQDTLPLDSKMRTKPADVNNVPSAPNSVLYGQEYTKMPIAYEWKI